MKTVIIFTSYFYCLLQTTKIQIFENQFTTDSVARITQERIDLVMRSVSELRETMAEWLNENIDYEEQRYDSLGRLISNIRRTTNRAGGKSVSKTDSQSVYVGLTAEQVDSLLSVRLSAMKADLLTKEKVVEKKKELYSRTWV